MRQKGQGSKIGNRYRVYKNIDGRKRSFTGKTLAIAKERRDEAVRRGISSNSPRFGAFLEHWCSKIEGRLSHATLRSYRSAIDRVKKHPIAGTRVADLKPAALESFYATILGSRAPAQVRTILGTALDYAIRENLTARNAAKLSDPPKRPKAPEKPMVTPGFLAVVLEHADEPFATYFAFLADTAMRPDREALKVRPEDVYQDTHGYWVRVRDSKTAAGVRDIPLSEEMFNRVRDAVPFGFSYSYAVDRWHRSCDRAGMPRTNLYKLRHFKLTMNAEKGIDQFTNARFAGHRDPRLIDSIYRDLERKKLQEVVR